MDPIGHVRALVATWRGQLILAFVVIQLLLPLHYYLFRRDPHDERYAWRMFSPMRMAHCEVQLTVDGQEVPLYSRFHEAWVKLAERGRFVVVEEMARTLCEAKENKDKRVGASLNCKYLDREPAHFGNDDMCKHPAL